MDLPSSALLTAINWQLFTTNTALSFSTANVSNLSPTLTPIINRTVERIMRAPTRTTVNLVCTIVKTDDCHKVCTCTQFRFAHTPIVCDSGSYALRDSIPVSQKPLNIQRLKFLTIQLRIVRGIGFSSGLVVMGDFIRTNWNRCKLDYS